MKNGELCDDLSWDDLCHCRLISPLCKPKRRHGSTGVMTRPAKCNISEDERLFTCNNIPTEAAVAGIARRQKYIFRGTDHPS